MVDDVPSFASHTSKLPDRGTEVILLAKEIREILAARFCRHITDSKRSGERRSSVYQVSGEANVEILYRSMDTDTAQLSKNVNEILIYVP